MAAKTPALGSNPLKKSEAIVRGMLRGEPAKSEETPQDRRTSPVPETSGLLRKTIYFDAGEWQAIRARCYQEDLTYTEIVRAAVRAYLGLNERDSAKTS